MHRLTLPVTLLFLIGLLSGARVHEPIDPNVSPLQQLFVLKEIRPDIERIGIIWHEPNAKNSGLLPQIHQASAATGIKVFLSYAAEITDVAPAYRDLIRRNEVQAIWIVDGGDPIVSSRIGRGFLIKNTASQGLPLIAPDEGWVEDGAHISFFHDGTNVRMKVNKRSADAANMTIPVAYLERTDFLAAN